MERTPYAPSLGEDSRVVRLEFAGSALQVLGWLVVVSLVGLKISFPPFINVRIVSINVPVVWIALGGIGAWVFEAVCRWFCRSLRFSDGGRAEFSGRGGQIFVWWMAWVLAGQRWNSVWLDLAFYAIGLWGTLEILGWFVKHVEFDSGRRFEFDGDLGGLVKWELLLGLSVLTVVGWAWVMAALYRWVAENTRAEDAVLEFHGSGGEILWRTFATVVFCVPVVTIPWALTWYVRWMVSQFTIGVELGSTMATALDPVWQV